MNQHLKTIQDIIQQNNQLSEQDKEALIKAITDADKQWSINDFKLDRTEKVKKTTAILLEETIEELEQKRKAVEAQNRELEIESSLEKVRTVAMGMRKRDDMLDICHMMSKQLELLGIKEIRNVQTAIFYKEKGMYVNYEYYRLHDKALVTDVDYTIDRLSSVFAAHMMKGPDEFFTRSLAGKEVQDWYNFQKTTNVFIDTCLEKATSLTYYWFSLGPVAIGMSSYLPLSAEDLNLFKRFRNVFGLAYQRYIDIEKAEAQAKESQIEAALERVRSRTLAMQRSDELAETAAVLFQQLITLGIEPNRLYIAIVKDENGEAEFWITDEDGSKVSTAYTANLNDNPAFSKMYEGWKNQKKSLVIDMQGEELNTYFRHLTSIGVPFKGGLTQKRRVQDIAYFNKGFIGMASPDEQPAETLQLMERFGYVFNLTFTRFNDLKIAEAHALQAEQDLVEIKTAKQKAEEALTELQFTQKQLIQSEKMASLGELTAGIAHEIQNPLNFVNNFSEVNTELIEELQQEMDKGNLDGAKVISDDIKENEQKINHHGKRADAIVKGMLQHSRSSCGVKEPTDLNALVDEYLRLAYHGLRAKDKSFNATMKTDFDESIGNVSIIPQDIGRVVLNLINNAFYAVAEKKKQAIADYEPAVSVSTKKLKDSIEISLKDNGAGIPQKVVDKIFQPFFTTKPTGQGTGLGLSLSYDIIKAHGGNLTVKSNEGEGAEFIVNLPI